MSIRQRVKTLEKSRHGDKPPFAVVISRRVKQMNGESKEIERCGPVRFAVPDGPLGTGELLAIKKTEALDVFRERIHQAYVAAWGCRHYWIERKHQRYG